jgi:excisionase family DNA binding protein
LISLSDDEPTGATRVARTVIDVHAAGLGHLPPVLTTREAAKALRIGVKEMRKLVDTGQIAAARIGPRRLIRISRMVLLASLSVRSSR